jgi:chaperonin GroES
LASLKQDGSVSRQENRVKRRDTIMAVATRSKTSIRPLDDRVLLKPTEAEDRTATGIYLPEGAKEKPMTGKVLATGPGKLNDDGSRTPLSIKKGDTVLFGKYSGTEVDLEDEKVVIMRENELLGILEK